MIKRLETAGAKGVVIFNRFYQPDIDLDTLQVVPEIHLSTEYESLLRIRWLALLRGQVSLSLAGTGGFHTHTSVLKGLMAGADAIYLCSVLLQKGPAHVTTLLENILSWMEQHEYESVEQMQGSVAAHHAIDPTAYERENYLAVMAKAKHYRAK
jgi:dihydroorotate dehydrogenase (fumarate)